MKGPESSVSLKFPERNTDILIEARIWGISGNHEIITVKDANRNVLDSSQIQIFYTSEIYYSRKGANTLVIYTPESSFKTLLDSISNVKLEVVAIDNYYTINDLSQTYKSRGLSKLSAYENMKE
jgi:hypothetical protein